MGLGFGEFLAMWALMMTAMMLPTAARSAGADGKGLAPRRVVGYLIVWAATGFAAYGLVRIAGWLAMHHDTWATVTAVGVLVLCGAFQFSPFKVHTLARCRAIDGVRGGLLCVTCSWAVMATLIVAGVMNIAVMVALSLFVYAERYASRDAVRRLGGFAAIGWALAVVIQPALAPGLHGMPMMTS
jgi:predicted metal-binding membrane protein